MMLRYATFSKNVLEFVHSKVSLTSSCTVAGAIYQNVLDCEWRMASFTYWLTLFL